MGLSRDRGEGNQIAAAPLCPCPSPPSVRVPFGPPTLTKIHRRAQGCDALSRYPQTLNTQSTGLNIVRSILILVTVVIAACVLLLFGCYTEGNSFYLGNGEIERFRTMS